MVSKQKKRWYTNRTMDITTYFQEQLNNEQQRVVAPYKGILVVTAGAGSGKTRVITARMAYLMMHHAVSASQIVALTFTNKAAKEMKERIKLFLTEEDQLPYVGTFHSYCLRILKSNTHLLPFSTFSLMDEQDAEKLAKQIITEKNLVKKLKPRQLKAFVSRVKNEATTEKEREALWADDLIYRDLFYLYEERKMAARCLDFDDLLLHTLELFRKNDLFRKVFQEHVKHILVDEYQDTNKVQHALLKLMTKHDGSFALHSLCVVGDEDQSIYSWRGATVTNIINFHKDFPEAEPITIEQNYRSVQPILTIANEVIKNNMFRNPKKLFSGKEATDRIRVLTSASGFQEAESLATFLKLARSQSGLDSHAILYRSHFQSRSLEEAFIRHAIPYKIMGGIQFYDRLEIKDMLAYMRLIINPFDRLALSRIINRPSRSLGPKFEELFFTTWDMMPFESFQEVGQALIEQQKITGVKLEAFSLFLEIFKDFTPAIKPSTVLQSLITRTGYYSHLDKTSDKEEAAAKKENIKELVNAVLFYEERNPDARLDAFLEEVALLQEQMNTTEETSDYVKLMTFHAAKGLEFDTVILTGVEEGILPSSRSIFNPESLEEERRLLYVGITRARERLLIMKAKYRYLFGQLTDQQPSRFINEIPDDHAPQDDSSYWKDFQVVEYFANWLSGEAPRIKEAPQDDFTYEPAFQDESPTWQRHQSVMHKKFGRGVIERVEQRSTGTHLTIRFKTGIKKLDSSFIAPL